LSQLAAAVWFGASIAAAQGLDTHRPFLPSVGVATEGGPGSIWVNPANLAYDPDRRYGVYYSRRSADDLDSLAAVIGVEGLSLGVHNRSRPSGDDILSDWSLDYGTSIALPRRLAVGLTVSWAFIDGGTNFLAYDAGLSWRPQPWFGISAAAQNVGGPDPAGAARPRTAAGIAVRPFGDLAILGAEFARTFTTTPSVDPIDRDVLSANLRVRPIEGLFVRGGVNTELLDTRIGPVTVGAGIELYLGGVGVGGHLATDQDGDTVSTGWIGTDEPGESLVRRGRRVNALELEGSTAYTAPFALFSENSPTWLETLELLRDAEEDPGLRGLVLTLDDTAMSFAQYRELRTRVERLEEADKRVLVYLPSGAGNGAVLVASAASFIALHPAAHLELVGVSVELTHLRGLLDIVGVAPQFVRRGQYKSGPETYTHPEPSAANLEMQGVLLDDLFGALVTGIATGRGVEEDTVRQWIDGGPYASQEALDAGIVDALLYPDQLSDALERIHGGSVAGSNLLSKPRPHSAWEDPKQLAIVYIDAPIVRGSSSNGGLFSGRRAGSDSIVRALERADGDPQVRAVVIRVDSPGGSSLASDEIARAVQRVSEGGKPVVVSMGGVAASGGYYVSAGADAIWAEPETVTGSIGVFAGKFSASGLQKALGVHTTQLQRGRNAGMNSLSRPWDEAQRDRMQALIDHTYAQFKERVAHGRDMEPSAVEAVARGRVWSGQRAAELGLVDHIGGFQEAIADARQRAGIPPTAKVGLVTYTRSGSLFDGLVPSLIQSVAAARKRHADAQLEPLSSALDRIGPILLQLQFPSETVWMMDPWTLQVSPP